MDPEVRKYFVERLEQKKRSFLNKITSLTGDLFSELLVEFDAFAESEHSVGHDQPSTAHPQVGLCVDQVRNKMQQLLMSTYQEVFSDYEECVDFGETFDVGDDDGSFNGDEGVQMMDNDHSDESIGFEATKVKRRKRKPGLIRSDKALSLMNKRPRSEETSKPFYCKWPECGHTSASFYNMAKHVRHHHFKLPHTKQEQDELNIVDNRDPLKFVGELTEENPEKEFVVPTEEDLIRPEYSRPRKFECHFPNCGRTFMEKSCFLWHERLHLGLKPFKCIFDDQCPFSSLKRSAVRRHVRQKHFRLPKTLKKQAAMNIVDTRDPDEYIAEDKQQLSQLLCE